MEEKRFDNLAKRFAGLLSRREVMTAVGVAGAAITFGDGRVVAQVATPPSTPVGFTEPEWLFVVSFGTAEISLEESGSLEITIQGIASNPVAFTDRPWRQFELLEIGDVVDAINDASDDPLNAVIVGRLPDSRETADFALELESAEYESASDTVTLQAKSLIPVSAGGTPTPAVAQGGVSLQGGSLFIDSAPTDCPYDVCEDGTCCSGICNEFDGSCCLFDVCGDGTCCSGLCNEFDGSCCMGEAVCGDGSCCDDGGCCPNSGCCDSGACDGDGNCCEGGVVCPDGVCCDIGTCTGPNNACEYGTEG